MVKRLVSSLRRTSQPKLFTPGPLNTSAGVKEPLQYDYGTREPLFLEVVRDTKSRLIQLASLDPTEYAVVLMQGSGTFSIEAMIGVCFPRTTENKMLIIANGAYGERQVKICEYYQIPYAVLRFPDNEVPVMSRVIETLRNDKKISHVSIVHSETTTGLLNPIEEIGAAIAEERPGIVYLIDGMSSFGAIPIDFLRGKITYLTSSPNKMIQSVPGFSYTFAHLPHFKTTKGNARSMSLDLYDQYSYGLENDDQFRFTPPAGNIIAFHQGLIELEKEGGVEGRQKRYRENQRILQEEMLSLGFQLYLKSEYQGLALTTFIEPKHPMYDFTFFYQHLYDNGIVIYPGKLGKIPSFRIGNIGELYPPDIRNCVEKIKEAFKAMGVPLPLSN